MQTTDPARFGPRVWLEPSKLTAARKAANLTQEELARKAGITKNSVNNLETGKVQPRFGTINAIAQALGIPLEDLIGANPEFRPNRTRRAADVG